MNKLGLEGTVEFLWEQCVCKEEYAYRNLDNLVGRGKINDFVYDKDRLDYYQLEVAHIASSLAQNNTELRYYDLAYEANGNRWTDYYCEVEKAVSLMHASGILEFCTPSKDWDAAESKNPKVRIKK